MRKYNLTDDLRYFDNVEELDHVWFGYLSGTAKEMLFPEYKTKIVVMVVANSKDGMIVSIGDQYLGPLNTTDTEWINYHISSTVH